MMRGRDAIAVASAIPTARSSRRHEPLRQRVRTAGGCHGPFLRGLIVLYETLVVGTRMLMRPPSRRGRGRRARQGHGRADAQLTLALAIGLFFLLPLFLSR